MKSWLSENLVTILLGLLGIGATVGVAYWQLHKYVEADFTVTAVRIKTDTPTQRVYAIDFDLNNSGNQSVTLVNAVPYLCNRYPPPKPPNELAP